MNDKKKLTAKDFDQKILELYDYYAHGKITKREFFKKYRKIYSSWRNGYECF